MADHANSIKSMKLYTHIDRVYRELNELGKSAQDLLDPSELASFDQLHYHGVDAVQYAVNSMGITDRSNVLEIGSGFGGPARHIAKQAPCRVTALELQPDQNDVARVLTERCGLSPLLSHRCGDFMETDWNNETFDAIVSWLAIYHIPDRKRLLEISSELLDDDGLFFTEDLYCRQNLESDEKDKMSAGLYAAHLPDFDTYQQEFRQAGFEIVEVRDMSDDWAEFTSRRLQNYRSSRDRHIRVHNRDTFEAMEEFYSFVNGYFVSGKLGGIRLVARKLS